MGRIGGLGAALLGLAAVACSPSSPAAGPACTVAGQYLATGTTQSGNCPGTTMPVADTFTVSGTSATLVFAGLTGPGCTGPIDGCSWTCSTTLMETDALDPANAQLAVQYAYTFTQTGLSGTLAETADATSSLPQGCMGVIEVTGTRQ